MSLQSQMLTVLGKRVRTNANDTQSIVDGIVQGLSIDGVAPTDAYGNTVFTNLQASISSLHGLATAPITVTLDKLPKPIGDIDMQSHQIIDLADPTADQDAATQAYVNRQIGNIVIPAPTPATTIPSLDLIPPPKSFVTMATQQLKHLSPATDNEDAITLAGVHEFVDPINTALTTSGIIDAVKGGISAASTLAGFFADMIPGLGGAAAAFAGAAGAGGLAAAISMGGSVLSGVAAPLLDTDATNKKYVDDKVATPMENIDMKSLYTIHNLSVSPPVADGDVACKKYVDSSIEGIVFPTQTAATTIPTLDAIPKPLKSVDFGGFTLTSVADPVNDQDAATRAYVTSAVSSGISGITIPAATVVPSLDKIGIPVGPVDMVTYKIINLGTCTDGPDAANMDYVDKAIGDAIKLIPVPPTLSIPTLDKITAPIGPIDMNNHQINFLAEPSVDTDAATQFYVKQQIQNISFPAAAAIPTLDAIPAPIGPVTMNNHQINFLAGPSVDTDAATQGYVKTAITNISTTLDQIPKPVEPVSMDNLAIIDVGDPSNNQDAATKYYVDQKILNLPAGTVVPTLDAIRVPIGAVNMNYWNIENLGGPTTGTDATSKDYVDECVRNVSIPSLEHIGIPYGPVNLNYQRIEQMAEPTDPADATTKHYVDLIFGEVPPPVVVPSLEHIGIPYGPVNLNYQRIEQMGEPTDSADAATKHYVDNSTPAGIFGVSLDKLALPVATCNMNNQRLTGLPTGVPVSDSDVVSNGYMKTVISNLASASQQLFASPLNVVSMVQLTPTTFTNVPDPINPLDAANKEYVDGAVANATGSSSSLNPIANVSMNSHKLTSVADPTDPQDAATKNYTDTVASGLQSTLNGFGQELSGLGDEYANLASDILSLKTSRTSDESNIGTAQTNISTLQGQMTTANTNIGTNTTSINTVIGKQTTDETNITNLLSDVSGLKASRTTDEGNITTLLGRTLNAIAVPIGDVSMNSHHITNLLDPVNAQDAATKAYVGSLVSSAGFNPTTNVSMNTYRLTQVGDPVGVQDVATKNYVDTLSAYALTGSFTVPIWGINGGNTAGSSSIFGTVPATNLTGCITAANNVSWWYNDAGNYLSERVYVLTINNPNNWNVQPFFSVTFLPGKYYPNTTSIPLESDFTAAQPLPRVITGTYAAGASNSNTYCSGTYNTNGTTTFCVAVGQFYSAQYTQYIHVQFIRMQ